MERTDKKFEQEISELRTKLCRMGDLIIEQMEQALRCLREHDFRGARMVVERDVEVNRMDIDLEEMCFRFLALYQPVAGDLRLITAVMKIATELERIGDRLVDVCGAVHDHSERDSIESHDEISRMGALATVMVRDSMTAFSQTDASVAKKVFEKDKEFDALYCETFSRLMTAAKEPEKGEHDTRLALLSKDLNEISEHATNIAEGVMFMVDGKEITHMDMHERRGSGTR